MTTASKLLGPLVLCLYVALVLSVSGLAAPASGPGFGTGLLHGHLADPTAAALLRAGGLVLLGLGLWLARNLVPVGPAARGGTLAVLALLVLWLPSFLPTWATGASLSPRLGLFLLGLAGLALVARAIGPRQAPY